MSVIIPFTMRASEISSDIFRDIRQIHESILEMPVQFMHRDQVHSLITNHKINGDVVMEEHSNFDYLHARHPQGEFVDSEWDSNKSLAIAAYSSRHRGNQVPVIKEYTDDMTWAFKEMNMGNHLSSWMLRDPGKVSNIMQWYAQERFGSDGQENIFSTDDKKAADLFVRDYHAVLRGMVRKFHDNEPSQIYVLAGNSGTGKSTILDGLFLDSIETIPKVTTRVRRIGEKDGELEFVSDEAFAAMMQGNRLLIPHKYRGQKYGINLDDFKTEENEFMYSDRHKALTLTDFDAATHLKNLYPDKVKLVAVLPPFDLVGLGLEKRMFEQGSATDAQLRLEDAHQERKVAEAFAKRADIVLEKTTPQANLYELNQRIWR